MFKKRLLCYSVIGRKVHYYEIFKSIESSGQKGQEASSLKDKKLIILTARIHPGEHTSSWVMKGAIETLLLEKEGQCAEYLLDNFHLVVIPMMNPDGVSFGNSRCSLAGTDLNKVWNNPDRFTQPEVYYAKKLFTKLKQDNEIAFFCDIHSTLSKKGCFVFGSGGGKDFGLLLDNDVYAFDYAKCK